MIRGRKRKEFRKGPLLVSKKGYDHAQYNLGYLYGNGKRMERDLGKAFYWYQKSAENENKVAQYNLGFFI